MRIAWATPFSTRSAIGQISRLVTDALVALGHEVLIIRTEQDVLEESISTRCQLIWWKECDARSLQQDWDAIFVNIGDQYAYHAGALELIERAPCIGIFHDFYLYNLFSGWLASAKGGPDRHDEEIRRVYGDHTPVRLKGAHDLAGIESVAQHTPMTEWVAVKCAAAIAHSEFYADRLRSSCPGPIAVAQLPARDIPIKPYVPSPGRFVVATIGIINPNKCADTVISALGTHPELRDCAEYRLVGAIADTERRRLMQVAEAVGFSNLTILGAVDDATLYSEIEAADVLCCLRSPVLEGASASAIEGLKSGRPIIVANAGFYADLPDEFVQKVSSVSAGPVGSILNQLQRDDSMRINAGREGRAWALKTFDVYAYAKVVEVIAAEMINTLPLHFLTRRVGNQLASLKVAPGDPRIEILGSEMAHLFARAIVDRKGAST